MSSITYIKRCGTKHTIQEKKQIRYCSSDNSNPRPTRVPVFWYSPVIQLIKHTFIQSNLYPMYNSLNCGALTFPLFKNNPSCPSKNSFAQFLKHFYKREFLSHLQNV